MTGALREWRAAADLEAIDVAFAERLGALVGAREACVLVAAALTSRATRAGHVCLPLHDLAGRALVDQAGVEHPDRVFPELGPWCEALRGSGLVGATGAPLVLEGTRLYLARYLDHEQRLAERVLRCAASAIEPPEGARALLRERLTQLFPDARPDDGQRLAAVVAALGGVTVVTGGPGTGKTTTVVRIVSLVAAALQEPRVLLLVPTGKAAQRLGEAVARARARLAPELTRALPDLAITVHRALGARPDGTFKAGPDHPLAADLVVVDEASMVDVETMRRLFDALAPHTRVVLVGDEHQLASVEAGAVLADLCAAAPGRGFTPALAALAERTFGVTLPIAGAPAPLGDRVVRLDESYRFGAGSAIGRLARAIHAGRAEDALAVCGSGEGEVSLVDVPVRDRAAVAARLAADGYAAALSASDVVTTLRGLDAVRVLAAHRRGPLSVQAVNQAVERELALRGVITPGQDWYRGRVVLVTENDPSIGLYNGDVGVVHGDNPLRAYFEVGGAVRDVSRVRIPDHETAFALSVHKSQGSEFDHAVVVLPEPSSPLCTRELVYTAVTRARQRVTLVGSAASLRHALEHPVRRASGLADRLRG